MLSKTPAQEWIDTYLRKRLTLSSPADGADSWLIDVLARAARGELTVTDADAVAMELAACDVLLTTDIHTCLLHQAAYWVLVQALEAYCEATQQSVAYALEALKGEAVCGDGQIASEAPVLATSGMRVDVLETELRKRWKPPAKFIPLALSRYPERMKQPDARRPDGSLDWLRVSMEDIDEVNRSAAAMVGDTIRAHPRTKVGLMMGVAHAHATPTPLVGALAQSSLRVCVLHPYCPELLEASSIRDALFAGKWLRVGEGEYLAPLPREIGVALGMFAR